MELTKAYNPGGVEDKIYRLWQEHGFFNPDKLPAPDVKQKKNRKKSFSIVLPPPNITGSLHIGHALNATVQDIIIRRKRMQGYSTLWLPGTDHAGIAAQNVVEKELKKDGLTRFDLGREEFLKRMRAWREKYGNIILDQLKKLGASCDWSRTSFTMDENYSLAVKTAFEHYRRYGWIYRAKKVVNWCRRCQTSLSDLELEYKPENGKLWYIKYPLVGSKNHITIATTRPETMLGDTAVAVNPKDVRYKKLVGRKVVLPLVQKEIPIIADDLVDSGFGTGAVKVTPAHDLIDYEIGAKHKLETLQVIDENGRITDETPLPYRRLPVLEAREKVVEDLKNAGLVEKIEDYQHQIPKCYRCDTAIELIPSLQWFLKMDELAKLGIAAAKSGKIKFIPSRWEKLYLDWLKNVRDWCISRQLWWGHKIPIDGEEDVLDTWFSSALWSFATLGWPAKTKDLERFYPSDVLSTDRGIINLWVARMIFSGMEFIKKEPFHTVYIHATVLTKDGKRMSKSLGTGIDPLLLIDKYGADATRFGIAWQISELQDIKFGEENILMGKKFCNKLWNASRFVMSQINDPVTTRDPGKIKNPNEASKKITKILEATVKVVNEDLDAYRFDRAAQKIYHFFWHEFCDKYIELSKSEIKNPESETKKTLLYVLTTSLKLIHPFMPFITEEIYQQLPISGKKTCLAIEAWPE